MRLSRGLRQWPSTSWTLAEASISDDDAATPAGTAAGNTSHRISGYKRDRAMLRLITG